MIRSAALFVRQMSSSNQTIHTMRDLNTLFAPLLHHSTPPPAAPMQLGVIVLGGALPRSTRHFAQHASVLVLGDSGADGMRRIDSNLQPAVVVGDFDSVTNDTLQFYAQRGVPLQHEADQDEHDFDKCVRALLARVPSSSAAPLLDVLVLGALGGSITHEFASFNTLVKYCGHPRIRLSLLSDDCFATVAPPGRSVFRLARHGARVPCGIIPIGEPAHDVTTSGFRWNLCESTG